MSILSVICDTNFLMVPGEFGVDVFGEVSRIIDQEYELVAPEPVKGELQKLSKERGEEGKAARIALMLMEKKGVEVVETEKRTGDASIVEVARKMEEPAVGTNDKNLKKQLKERSIPVISLRTKDHLEVEGSI